ncbi:HEAT repeat domain-containing protein [Intrasporangium sp. YIM S08009]|uniref:HEAT repeat domain-containing protein n=1 Tax=Intrasporangium zincisolvens TaxID=3080018 RepID=UPI002B05BB25|nr:HEAT repeat domain-containing protein [Intrasporangium sp. YIM S08009]
MTPDEVLDASPADRARAAADALGDDVLVAWCADLLAGRRAWGEPGSPDLGWVGGRASRTWGAPDRLVGERDYWARVWAARTMLYVWSDDAIADVVAALDDPAWRVREMCAKVAARWDVGEAGDACARLVTDDDTTRVRAAAARVLGAVGESEHAPALHEALADAEESVRDAAERALRAMRVRLDRNV